MIVLRQYTILWRHSSTCNALVLRYNINKYKNLLCSFNAMCNMDWSGEAASQGFLEDGAGLGNELFGSII